MDDLELISWFDEVSMDDRNTVGGKGASLGEMHINLSNAGVNVPNGFNVTVDAYQKFVNSEVPASTWDNIREPDGVEKIRSAAINSKTLADALEICLDGADPKEHLNMHGRASLARALVRQTPVPER